MLMKKPIIAITMGDPSGIGPEVVLKALEEPEVYKFCAPVVIGSREVLERSVAFSTLVFKVRLLEDVTQAVGRKGTLDLVDLNNVDLSRLQIGTVNADAGQAALEYIARGLELVLGGKVQALTTAPVSKEAIERAGHPFPGHTEFLAQGSKTKDYCMMMVGDRLRVSLATTHVPLSQVPSLLKTKDLLRKLELTHEALGRLGLKKRRIGMASLNPHGGEAGLFGKEEEEILRPAVTMAQEKGLWVEGPFPADTLFFKAYHGHYEAVLAMYHDQGLVPLKMVAFYRSVNITLGLPFVRTSVGHGTAFDITGKGVASATSLIEALKVASQLARAKHED